MPLLMCPNDNAPMQTLDRHGVQFDMCPTCRGVWLDRGELEKLMAAAGDEGRAAAPAYAPPPQQSPPQPQQPWGSQPTYREPPRDRDDRYDHDRRRDDDYHYRKKKKRLDIFDIFD
ncbi:TFIIB-type zinc ribbon-containing protein [Brevundimonas phoenicis]|uniref:TFIIB-type zinc ribbon-containing protein n=1 Tax=unclassified Brevundimonas TaxID=2622653 RepID=UPI00399F479F